MHEHIQHDPHFRRSGATTNGGSPGPAWWRSTPAVVALLSVLATGCAAGPSPGDPGYAYQVDGRYRGSLVVDEESFDTSLDLTTGPGGRVRGSFTVSEPLEIDGDVTGAVMDDLLRITLTYEAEGGGPTCPGRIEGVLTISAGGGAVDGPVTVTDCVDELVGRLSFRRGY